MPISPSRGNSAKQTSSKKIPLPSPVASTRSLSSTTKSPSVSAKLLGRRDPTPVKEEIVIERQLVEEKEEQVYVSESSPQDEVLNVSNDDIPMIGIEEDQKESIGEDDDVPPMAPPSPRFGMVPANESGPSSRAGSSRRMSVDSDVSSLSQSTFQSKPFSSSRSNTPGNSSRRNSSLRITNDDDGYHPLKWSSGDRETVVTSKGYTPKASSRKSIILMESPEKEFEEQFLQTSSKSVKSSSGVGSSRSITPNTSSKSSKRPSLIASAEPVLSPKQRAKMQAEQEEQRRIEEENARIAEKERLLALERERVEQERLEAERIERERLEAERLEAERIERERLEAIRLENERIQQEKEEAERLERERLEAERLEQERIAQIEAEKQAKQDAILAKKRAAAEQKAAAEAEKRKIEEAARAEAERRASERMKLESKRKAEQEAAKAKAVAERKAKEEALKAAELERKALLEAKREKSAMDRKKAAEAVRGPKVGGSQVNQEPDAVSESGSRVLTIEEEKRMLARARIEEERRLVKEKEQRLLERKAALEQAKAEAKRKAIEDTNRRLDEKKKAVMDVILAEKERKLKIIAMKAKSQEDRQLQEEAEKIAAAADAERKAAEKRERKLQADLERAAADEQKANQKLKNKRESKANLDQAREEAQLESERKKEAAAAALLAVEEARAAEAIALAEARAKAEADRELAYELARNNPLPGRSRSGSRSPTSPRSRSGSNIRSRGNSFTGSPRSSPRVLDAKDDDIHVGIGPSDISIEEEEIRLKAEIANIEQAIREAEDLANKRKAAAELARRELEKLAAEELNQEEEIRANNEAIAALEAEEAEEEARQENERKARQAAVRRNSMQSNPSSAPVSRQKSNSMSKGSDQQKPDRKTLTSRLSGIFGFSKRKNVTNADDDDDVSEQNEKDIPIKDPERQKAIEAEVAAAEKERQRIHAEKEEAARVLALEQEKLRQAEEALKEQHAREARLRLQEETISNALRDIVRVRADTDHASQERFQQQLTAKLVEESKANEEIERKAAPQQEEEKLAVERAVETRSRGNSNASNTKGQVTHAAPTKALLSARPAKSPAPAQRQASKPLTTTAPKSQPPLGPSRSSKSPGSSSFASSKSFPIKDDDSSSIVSNPKAIRGRNSLKTKQGLEALESQAQSQADKEQASEVQRAFNEDEGAYSSKDIGDEITQAETAGKRKADETAKKERERVANELAMKEERDRNQAVKEKEIQTAARASKQKEKEESDLRSEREAAQRSGLMNLAAIGRTNRLIYQLAARFDEVIQILMKFKCNKNAGEEMAKRLSSVANIIATLFGKSKMSERDYKSILDDLIQKIIDAKKFFLLLASPGFLVVLLRGNETLQKFEEFDHRVMELLADLVEACKAEHSNANCLPAVTYHFYIVDEAAINNARSNPQALKSLAKVLSAELNDMNYEVNHAVIGLNNMVQEVTELGAQRQLVHPAIKTFWRIYFNSSYKVESSELVENAMKYIKTDVKPDLNDEEMKSIALKLNIALDVIDSSPNHSITVFELNQTTKHLDFNYDFLQLLHAIFEVETLKVFPSITEEQKDIVEWGEGMAAKVGESMKSAGMWSIVFGAPLSGKTFRWLVGAHHLDNTDAVVWIDFRNVKTTSDMLSTIATQLSLSVLSLDDVMLEFSRLLDSSLEHSSTHCCIVLDHVDMDALDQLAPFIKILKRLQTVLKLAIVMITTSSKRPASSTIATLYKIGKIPIKEELLNIIEVLPLSQETAVALANRYDVYDPSMLVTAARCLPGEMMRMQTLRSSQLASISNGSNTSSIIDLIIADTFTENETLCATCLYYPLTGKDRTSSPIFHKALAWELCRKSMEENIDLWYACMDRLVSVGWLKLVGDEGYVIASTSVLPGHPNWVTITETEQWEKYYRYWIKESIRMNDLLGSKDQLLGCAFFDSSRKHFEIVFSDFTVKPVLYGRVRQQVITDLVIQYSSNVSNLYEYRFGAPEGLALSFAVLRILCDNDETGLLVDDRYWRHNRSLQPIIIRACINLGWFLNRNQQAAQAEKIVQNALLFMNDSDPINYAYALNKLAIILRALGRKEECLQTHQRCLNIRLKSLGENHVDTAQSMNNIAIVLNSLGRKEEALSVHNNCLKIRIELLGVKHASTGDTYYNMATVLRDMGRKEETLRCYEKAKIAYVATYGEGHSYVKDVIKKMNELLGKRDNIEPTTPGRL